MSIIVRSKTTAAGTRSASGALPGGWYHLVYDAGAVVPVYQVVNKLRGTDLEQV